jgi:hypothetical protein
MSEKGKLTMAWLDIKWNGFGTKASLCQQIADINGIDLLVLYEADPTRRAVAERISWALERSTSRIKDTHYIVPYRPVQYVYADAL